MSIRGTRKTGRSRFDLMGERQAALTLNDRSPTPDRPPASCNQE